jgi:transposase
MIRTEVLREIRKMRFLEVYEKSRLGRLSYGEAAETLGLSERQFRRLRGRFEAEGEMGLLDRRVGKASGHRIAADEVSRIVSLYQDRYAGWTVQHFHERAQERHGLTASYGWTKSVLYAAGAARAWSTKRARPRASGACAT